MLGVKVIIYYKIHHNKSNSIETLRRHWIRFENNLSITHRQLSQKFLWTFLGENGRTRSGFDGIATTLNQPSLNENNSRWLPKRLPRGSSDRYAFIANYREVDYTEICAFRHILYSGRCDTSGRRFGIKSEKRSLNE